MLIRSVVSVLILHLIWDQSAGAEECVCECSICIEKYNIMRQAAEKYTSPDNRNQNKKGNVEVRSRHNTETKTSDRKLEEDEEKGKEEWNDKMRNETAKTTPDKEKEPKNKRKVTSRLVLKNRQSLKKKGFNNNNTTVSKKKTAGNSRSQRNNVHNKKLNTTNNIEEKVLNNTTKTDNGNSSSEQNQDNIVQRPEQDTKNTDLNIIESKNNKPKEIISRKSTNNYGIVIDQVADHIIQALVEEHKAINKEDVTSERLKKARLQHTVLSTIMGLEDKLRKLGESGGEVDKVTKRIEEKVKRSSALQQFQDVSPNAISVRHGVDSSPAEGMTSVATDYMKLVMSRI